MNVRSWLVGINFHFLKLRWICCSARGFMLILAFYFFVCSDPSLIFQLLSVWVVEKSDLSFFTSTLLAEPLSLSPFISTKCAPIFWSFVSILSRAFWSLLFFRLFGPCSDNQHMLLLTTQYTRTAGNFVLADQWSKKLQKNQFCWKIDDRLKL